MSMNLALKYRPKKFDDVVGQDNIVGILKNQIKSGRVKQAYLFTGPAGDGKTTTARILASVLNEGRGGIVEIDAASNNGVDNIRELSDNVKFKPIDTPYKIYIIDEVHMLSIGAFNGFLKTLEEPPKHAVFILCTTDPQKIPATVLSRCQRFDFQRMTVENIVKRLKFIVNCENEEIECDKAGQATEDDVITITEEVFDHIAKMANGGMRNAISLLDTCLGYKNDITLDDVLSILGTADYSIMFDITRAILTKDEKAIISIIEKLYTEGKDLKQFISQYCEFLVDIRKYQVLKSFDYIKISAMYEGNLKEVDTEEVRGILVAMITLNSKLKYESNVKPFIIGELMMLCL